MNQNGQVICDYCVRPAALVGGNKLYRNRPDLYAKQFYLCEPCWAYVGCHPGTTKPLGRLANGELRMWKVRAHAAFDPLWRSKTMSRTKAYKWLSDQLAIEPKKTHIGMFEVEMCKKVVEVCHAYRPG